MNKIIHSNQLRYRIYRHGLFWLTYLASYSFLAVDFYMGVFDGLQLAVRWLPFCLLNVYVTVYWLVDRCLLRSKYSSFVLMSCLWFAVLIVLAFLTHLYLVYPYCWADGPRPSFHDALTDIFDIYPIFVNEVVAGFAVFLHLYRFWRVELLQKLQLEQEKTDAELELLKAQLHPHFLFNTLNNLYTLILERSPRAPGMLLRLKAILSHVLHECQAPQVALKKEIAFCQDYIDLEKERYGDRLDIVSEFVGDIGDKMITPMLFQPFIENAFKHGAAQQLGKAWIDIRLVVDDNRLLFRVINSADVSAPSACSGGIGVANIQRRLQLIYPERHQLTRKQEEGIHSISLTIDLAAPSEGRRHRSKKPPRQVRAGSLA